MKTFFDWTTIALFGVLVVLFLQRSADPQGPRDKIYQYAPPALGCAIANYLGNNGEQIAAIAVIVLSVGYTLFVLDPFRSDRPPL